ncbi:hypothetical protein [Gallaecimonas xiamenensis]|uniref:Uncharacterized protein n=1 Tax=Gallaecimonas xiamenensis 3-C-1 TaxID=745411 RepID=K2J6K3_9GAMM|nr:hypothetical protein [Gallaecimonas xiamenensis]EKE70567.1 hypothetical protein B3C1_13553 [Gallaecimonas xiamenensis 3-C-1]
MLSEADAEQVLIRLRQAINGVVWATPKFDPDAHNICFINLEMRDGRELIYYSFSNMSRVSSTRQAALTGLGYELVPDVSNHLKFWACGGMGQYHTEPRLVNYVFCRPGHLENIRRALIVTEIDCCGSCMNNTISPFVEQYPDIDIYTQEHGAVPSQGISPSFQHFTV